MAENYEQHYDGRIRTREQTIRHFKGHEKMKQTSDIEFVAMLEHEDVVFAHYLITRYVADKPSEKWTVLGRFIVQGNQIVRSDQLSKIID